MREKDLPILFVGLGNPGKQYQCTRHNIGFLVLEAFAQKLGLEFKDEKRFVAKYAKGMAGDVKVHLLKPETYMNASGESVQKVLNFTKWGADQVVVVCDDTAIPFGTLRLRIQGSDGGHNGLKSVATHLRTKHYIRLRMGVGASPFPGQDLADYVLAPFTAKEKEEIEKFIKRGVDVLLKLIQKEPLQVMNEVNTKNSSPAKKLGSKEGKENETTTRKPL